MNTTSHPANLNAGPSNPNPLQRFYQSRAFDIVCGVIPALLLGIYSLYISGVSVATSSGESAPIVLIIFVSSLSLLGLAGCVALLVSIVASARLSQGGRKICAALLSIARIVALILVGILIMAGTSPGNGSVELFVLVTLGLAISLSSLKQIRLLSSGGDGAVLRR